MEGLVWGLVSFNSRGGLLIEWDEDGPEHGRWYAELLISFPSHLSWPVLALACLNALVFKVQDDEEHHN